MRHTGAVIKLLLWPLRWILRILFALLILFEEWGWEPLRRAFAWLASKLPLRWLERRLSTLPPYGALIVLLLPSLLILPIKLGAVWLVAKGRVLLGVGVVIAAKVGGTALLAWLFHLIQPALMRLGWFARLFERWTTWKAELLAWVRASAVWRSARALKAGLRRWWRRVRGRPDA